MHLCSMVRPQLGVMKLWSYASLHVRSLISVDRLRPSIYALTRSEAIKSLANRLLHSRAYILFYLVMAILSITTMILGLVNGCPGPEFFIIEIIVNCAMIAEVGIRMVALSKVITTLSDLYSSLSLIAPFRRSGNPSSTGSMWASPRSVWPLSSFS